MVSDKLIMRNILFIAPLPPPICGQSKVSAVILQALESAGCEVHFISLNKKELKSGGFTCARSIEILKVIFAVWKLHKKYNVVFFSLAESFLGNIRDLLLYLVVYHSNVRVCAQILGGAQLINIANQNNFFGWLNRKLMKRINVALVESPINVKIFENSIPKNSIHIIPNFADDYLFVTDIDIKQKFSNLKKIRFLFLSNLINGKGYLELVQAVISLPSYFQDEIHVTFVGGFESKENKSYFLNLIKPYSFIEYIGEFIDGVAKRDLYAKSHIFCLPTYYPYEGQPISILEGYASGCVVMTTAHSGIPHIFTQDVNGYLVDKQSSESIQKAIKDILENRNRLIEIATHNLHDAMIKYRLDEYKNKILNAIIEID